MAVQTYEPLEAMARLYCVKSGIDPDEEVAVPHPLGLSVPYFVTRWQVESERLLDLSRMLSAMKEVRDAQTVIVQ